MKQSFPEYRYSKRGVIRAGQRFRVSGGPYYVTAEGQRISTALKGTFTFCRYCTEGHRKWIECTRPNEVTTERLPVNRTKAVIEGYTMRPYRVRLVRRKARIK